MVYFLSVLSLLTACVSFGNAAGLPIKNEEAMTQQFWTLPLPTDKGAVLLLKLPPDETRVAFRIQDAGELSAVNADEKSRATLVLTHHSKGLGEIVSTEEVGRIWLSNGGTVRMQWADSDKVDEAAADLKYALVRIRGEDGHELARGQFVEPMVNSLKLAGVEPIKLAVPADIAGRLQLEVRALPEGWEQKTAGDGKSLTLKSRVSSMSFELGEGGTALKSRVIGPAAPTDTPKHRLAGVNRALALEQDTLKERQAAYERAGTQVTRNTFSGRSIDPAQEQASIQKAIDIVQAKITALTILRDKLMGEAANETPATGEANLPHGAILRVVLKNGVCVANVSLSGD